MVLNAAKRILEIDFDGRAVPAPGHSRHASTA